MRSRLIGLAGWMPNSFIDYPRTVSTVLFFSGCNLRCPYCHNSEIVTNPDDFSVFSDKIWDFLEKRKNVIDGIVLTGGEPTLHANIKKYCTEFHNLDYKIKLDSNGLLPDRIKNIAPDYLAMDLKTSPSNYASLLKASYSDVFDRLNKSLAIVKMMKDNAEVRITMAPRIIKKEYCTEITEMLDGVKKVFLQPVNLSNSVMDPSFFKTDDVMENEIMEFYKDKISQVVESCEIRNKS